MTVDAPPRQLTDFLRSLRAVREFQRKPVPEDIVQDVLEVARWSGSASNRQFGGIIVVRQRETLEALATIGGYTGHLRGAALAMVPAGTRPRPQPRCWDSPGVVGAWWLYFDRQADVVLPARQRQWSSTPALTFRF